MKTNADSNRFLNRSAASKASAQLKIIISIFVFVLASALLISGISAISQEIVYPSVSEKNVDHTEKIMDNTIMVGISPSANKIIEMQGAIVNCGDNITTNTILDSDILDCYDGPVINTSDVVLDCAGHYINGSGNFGLTIDANNVTVKNCIISGFGFGINADSDDEVKISNNTIYSVTSHGIYLYGGANANVSDNTILNSSNNGISIVASSTNYIANYNKVYDCVAAGISVSGYGNVSYNIVNHSAMGVELDSFTGNVNYNNISYNTDSSKGGITSWGYVTANITNNNIYNGGGWGVYVSESSDNLSVWHNNIYSNFYGGIYAVMDMEVSNGSSGNFWGRLECPAFIAGVGDSNRADVIDSFAYTESNGWITMVEPPKCAPAINSFVNNMGESYELIGSGYSMNLPYNISLYANITNTSVSWVNLTRAGDGLCLGITSNNQMMNYIGNGIFNINCSVNKTVLLGLGSEYNLTAVAYHLSDPSTTKIKNFTIYSDFVNPVLNNIGVLNADVFFSPSDSMVYVYANVSDSNLNRVYANFTNITGGETGCDGDGNADMVYNVTSELYEGSCDIGSYITNTNFTGKQILVTAIDDYSNFAVDGFGIVTHDFGVPPLNKGSCLKLGDGSTNLSEELDFEHVDFTLNVDVNISCYMNTPLLPSEWRNGASIIIYDVNLSNQSAAQALSNMGSNIDVVITGPNSFGDSRIYINSNYFKMLNKSASLTIYGLPFTEQPNIIADSGAAGFNNSNITWATNGYDSSLGVVTGNITFNVYGFSGYNTSDNIAPTVNITAPTNGAFLINTTSTAISVIVNGTGTQLSNITASINNTLLFSYNGTEAIHGNCTNLTVGWDVVVCNKTATGLTDGTKLLTVIAKDFGGKSGNTANNTTTFIVDATAPAVTLSLPTIGTISNNNTIYFKFNASDLHLDSCILYYNNSTGYTPNSGSVPNNGTFTVLALNLSTVPDGLVKWYVWCNDTIGNEKNSSVWNFTIDRTAPLITFVSPTENSGTYKSRNNISANVSVTDMNIANITYRLYNSTFTLVNQTTYANTNSIVWTSLSDGLYYYNVTVYDSASNSNKTETRNVTLDTKKPIISDISIGSITNESIDTLYNTNELAKCELDYGTTTTYGSGIIDSINSSVHGGGIGGLISGTMYHYIINCTDKAGNWNATNDTTFTTMRIEFITTINESIPLNVIVNNSVDSQNKTIMEFEVNTNKNLTNIEINVTPSTSNPVNSTLSQIGVTGLNKYYAIESNALNNTTLNYVIIKVYYNVSEIPSGTSESKLRLYWYNTSSSKWEVIPGGVNTTVYYVWGNTTHFSNYSVGGETETSDGGGGGGGGSTGGGGGGGIAPTTYVLTTTLGRTLVMSDVINVSLNGTTGTIKLTSTSSNKATFLLKPSGQYVSIAIGDSVNVDLNSDGIEDVSIMIKNVTNTGAEVVMTKITGTPIVITPDINPTPALPNATNESSAHSAEAARGSNGTLIVIGTVLAIAVICTVTAYFVYNYVMKSKHKKA